MTITATYSPEDNKLRLYPSRRLDAETFERVKAAGFKWAPRQELFVAPKWTPGREDLATELAGEIEAEEMTLAERAAMKAERLDALASKRNREANAFARRADELSEAFFMGQPILVGHHSERKARKTQERMHAASDAAVKASRAANYWLYRAEGVEWFANMKNAPGVRARRIKTLLAELRDLQRGINAAHKARAIWEKVTAPADIVTALGNLPSELTCSTYGEWTEAQKGDAEALAIRETILARIAARIEGPTRRRWIEHTLNRLSYERSLLGDVARFDGELTAVILQAFAREHGAEKPTATQTDPGSWQVESPVPLPLHLASGCALDMVADDWRDLMQSVGYEVPAAKPRRATTSTKAACPIINPTAEQAEQLNRIWHAQATAAGGGQRGPFKVREVKELTQAVYSANSGGSYSPLKTIEIDANGERVREVWRALERVKSGEPVCRVRIFTSGGELYGPDTVARIVDKPTKALPIDLDAIEARLAAPGEPEAGRLAA